MAGQLALLVENQIRQGAPAEVAGAHAFAAVTAGQGDAVAAVHQHVRAKTPRHAEIAAPGVGDAYLLELREQLAEQVAAQVALVLTEVEVVAQLAAKAITATGAKHQTVVGAALAVGNLAAVLAEGLATLQADVGPDFLGQRFGGHQQALHR